MTDPQWLTTDRLGLRRFAPADLDRFASFYADADVTRFLGGVKTREQAAQLFEDRILRYYTRHPGLGVWATIERATGACIGMHVLNHIQGEEIVQVGFILEKPAWGKGYATEMAIALLRYGFGSLALPGIAAITDLDNVASQRALEKAGLTRRGERTFTHPAYAGHGPFAWFEADRVAWLDAHA